MNIYYVIIVHSSIGTNPEKTSAAPYAYRRLFVCQKVHHHDPIRSMSAISGNMYHPYTPHGKSAMQAESHAIRHRPLVE